MGAWWKKKIWLEIFFIFLLSLTPLLWFRPGEMMVGHDNAYPLNPKVFLQGRFYTWIENDGFGLDQSLVLGTIPMHLIETIPYFLGFSLITSQKIIFVFWFFLMGLAAYIFASLIKPESRFFKLAVAVFYQFNFFILQAWFIFERAKFSAYIAMPLILSVFWLVYRQKISVLKGAILNSLILFLFNAGGLFGIPLYGGFFLAAGIFIIFFSLINLFSKNYAAIGRLLLLAILTGLGYFLINSYYLLPAANQFLTSFSGRLGAIGGVSGVLAWAGEISIGASFLNLFRLQGMADWYDNPSHPYAFYFLTNPVLIFVSFIFPLLVFSSLILIRDKFKARWVLYFFAVYLTGIFFAAGTHPPLGGFYSLLVKIVPGFAIFRTPYYKFAPAIFLSNAFLVAFALDYFREKISKIRFLPAIFSFICIFGILAYHFPYFQGSFFNWRENFSTRVKIPQYVFEFGQWVENKKQDDFRILMLPPSDYQWQYDLYRWGYLSLFPLPRLLTNQPVITNSELLDENERVLLEAAYKSLREGRTAALEKIAYLLRIKYLLLRKDFAYSLDWTSTDNPETLKKVINEDFKFSKVKEFGEWELYELNFSPPGKFLIFSRFDFLNSPFQNLADYLDLSPQRENHFVLGSDPNSHSLLGDRETRFVVPRCLNCRHEKKPIINFPERKVLPDSLLYPLILLIEERRLKNGDAKSQIYDYIGLSLKRVGEIRELVLQRKILKKEYFNPYLKILLRIGEKYDQIQNFEEKFQIAEDLNYYLTAQKKYLQVLLGSKISYEKDVEEFQKIFLTLDSLAVKINPFLFKAESENNRLYSFQVEKNQTLELLVKVESLGQGAERLQELAIRVDDNLGESIKIKPENFKNGYLSLGKREISQGEHRLLLSLPPLANLTNEFSLREGSFWRKSTNCFSFPIKGFNNQTVYKINLSYLNDFSDDFLILIRKQRADGQIADNIFKFPSSHSQEEFEESIRSLEDINGISIELCAPELSEEILSQKIKLRVTEVVQPLLFLSSESQPLKVDQVAFKKVNPTKYRLKIKNAQEPFFLGFLEKFDKGWQIEGLKNNHFRLDGYANGWWIDQKGDYELSLEYKSQLLFYNGLLISALMVMGSLIYLLKTWSPKI